MKKFRVVLILLIYFIKVPYMFAQEKEYLSELLGVKLKLSPNSTVKNFEIEKGVLSEIYVVFDNSNNFKYSLTITKKDDFVNFNKIEERNEFKKAFLDECKCLIISETFKKYNNFMSYRLKIDLKNNLIGYTDSLYFNNHLYSFTYMSNSHNKFIKFEEDYFIFLKLIDNVW